MTPDAPGSGEDEMVELDVEVPADLLAEIDELAEELKYTDRSEFLGKVLRDTTEPLLTPGAREGVAQGYSDVASGRTMSTDEATQRLGIDES